MPTKSKEPAPAVVSLDDILLGYLLPVWPWPGGDGITTVEVLAYYPRAAALGQVPDREQLCKVHPQHSGELRARFAGDAPGASATRVDRGNRSWLPTVR